MATVTESCSKKDALETLEKSSKNTYEEVHFSVILQASGMQH